MSTLKGEIMDVNAYTKEGKHRVNLGLFTDGREVRVDVSQAQLNHYCKRSNVDFNDIADQNAFVSFYDAGETTPDITDGDGNVTASGIQVTDNEILVKSIVFKKSMESKIANSVATMIASSL